MFQPPPSLPSPHRNINNPGTSLTQALQPFEIHELLDDGFNRNSGKALVPRLISHLYEIL